jgi:hypothetical protein
VAVLDEVRAHFRAIVEAHGLREAEIQVTAVALSPEEAIGNPEHHDYPLLKGRERLMQADFRGAIGQAYTDMYGNYTGSLAEVLAMDLSNNFRRAIFVSTLNAVMRHLKLVDGTIHCKDADPPVCSQELLRYIVEQYHPDKVALVGMQPRMAEALASRMELRVTDMDPENIGSHKFGVWINGPEKTAENLDWCDLAVVTGTTAVSGTLDEFVHIDKPVIFYGTTISGVARVLGLSRFCYLGR